VDKFHDFLTLFVFYTIFKHVNGKLTTECFTGFVEVDFDSDCIYLFFYLFISLPIPVTSKAHLHASFLCELYDGAVAEVGLPTFGTKCYHVIVD
jgi:hypothetical protein